MASAACAATAFLSASCGEQQLQAGRGLTASSCVHPTVGPASSHSEPTLLLLLAAQTTLLRGLFEELCMTRGYLEAIAERMGGGMKASQACYVHLSSR